MNNSIVPVFCIDVIHPFLKRVANQTHKYKILSMFGTLLLLFYLCSIQTSTVQIASAQANTAPAMTPIYEIQGDGAASPLRDQWVDTYGVVTGVTTDGFYLQDPIGDGNLQTSDGLFVYTYHPPEVQVGQCAYIRNAHVIEFYAKTELSRVDAVELSTACPTTTIQPVQIPLAQFAQEPATLFEPYEGMLVSVESFVATVQGPTKRFQNGEAEIAFVDQAMTAHLPGGRLFRTDSAGMSTLRYLSNALGATLPDVGWGDTISITTSLEDGQDTVAILDYNFGKYQLLLLPGQDVSTAPSGPLLSSGLSSFHRPAQGFLGPGTQADFTICSFNTFGLGRGSAQFPDDAEYQAHLYKRALVIATQLEGCTIIGLQETGTVQDAKNLATLLQVSFGLDYVATALPGPGSSSDEFPLTNSFLTRRERVEINDVSLHQGCSGVDYGVIDGSALCAGGYPLFNRPPLQIDLTIYGDWEMPYRLSVINNHWKSKGGNESVNLVRREAQAQHVAGLVQERLDQSPDTQIVVLGDLNDFYKSGPLATIRTVPEPDLITLHDFVPDLQRYTYIFNGASQTLDHILITPKMGSQFAGIYPIRMNADAPSPAQVDPTTVSHASDHDPLLVRIRPAGTASLGGNLKFANIRLQLFALGKAGSDAAPTEPPLAQVVTDALGDFRIWDVPVGTYTLRYQPPEHIDLKEMESTISLTVGYNTMEATDVAHHAIMVATGMAVLSPEVALSMVDEAKAP